MNRDRKYILTKSWHLHAWKEAFATLLRVVPYSEQIWQLSSCSSFHLPGVLHRFKGSKQVSIPFHNQENWGTASASSMETSSWKGKMCVICKKKLNSAAPEAAGSADVKALNRSQALPDPCPICKAHTAPRPWHPRPGAQRRAGRRSHPCPSAHTAASCVGNLMVAAGRRTARAKRRRWGSEEKASERSEKAMKRCAPWVHTGFAGSSIQVAIGAKLLNLQHLERGKKKKRQR